MTKRFGFGDAPLTFRVRLGRLFLTQSVRSTATLLLTCLAFVATYDAAWADDRLTLKAMSFNIRQNTSVDGPNHWPKRRDAAIGLIRRFQGDFVGIQEALPDQMDDLRKMLPEYRVLGRSREADATRGEATPILYRHERWRLDPKQSGWFWLSDTPQKPGSITWGNACARMVTWARFIDGKTGRGMVVYNTHFDHVSEPSRQKSAALLARRIAERERPEPVVVMGDFNSGESATAVLHLTGRVEGSLVKLADTFRVLHPDEKEVKTFHAFRGGTAGEKIDYILASPGVKVLSAEILRDRAAGDGRDARYPSDHYPVTAEMSFPAE